MPFDNKYVMIKHIKLQDLLTIFEIEFKNSISTTLVSSKKPIASKPSTIQSRVKVESE